MSTKPQPKHHRPHDAQACTDFVSAHRAALLRYVVCLSDPGTDSEAIVQDVLERAWRHWPMIDTPEPWAFRAAQHLMWRNNKTTRETTHTADTLPETARWISTPPAAEPHRAAEAALVREQMLQLPRQQRIATYLYHIEGWSHREIAQVLGCKQSTVAVHIHRGTAALRAREQSEHPVSQERAPSSHGFAWGLLLMALAGADGRIQYLNLLLWRCAGPVLLALALLAAWFINDLITLRWNVRYVLAQIIAVVPRTCVWTRRGVGTPPERQLRWPPPPGPRPRRPRLTGRRGTRSRPRAPRFPKSADDVAFSQTAGQPAGSTPYPCRVEPA